MTEKRLYQTNDIEITRLELYNFNGDKLNIINDFINMAIREDMFAPCTTGSILMIDSTGIYEEFPIIGEETLVIEYRTDQSNEFILRKFYIYSVSDKERTNVKGENYVLNFCSEEFITNRATKVSRSFVNTVGSDVVKSILKNDLKSTKMLDVEESIGEVNYVSPQIHPVELIYAMAKRSRSAANTSGASYVFFENNAGFVFKTIESLIAQTPTKFQIDSTQSINTLGETAKQIIFAHQLSQTANTLTHMSAGSYGVNVKSLNLMNKTLTDVSYNYFDDSTYKANNHINSSSPANRLQTSQFKFKENTATFKFVVDSGDNFKSKNVGPRYAQLAIFANGPKMNCEVPFNSDITVGGTVYVDMKTKTAADKESDIMREDKYLAGKYLLTAVSHNIALGRATTSMELSKDTFTNDHEDR